MSREVFLVIIVMSVAMTIPIVAIVGLILGYGPAGPE